MSVLHTVIDIAPTGILKELNSVIQITSSAVRFLLLRIWKKAHKPRYEISLPPLTNRRSDFLVILEVTVEIYPGKKNEMNKVKGPLREYQ